MKTTSHHFKVFQEECRRLARDFGLTGWELYFNKFESAEHYAKITKDLRTHIAVISLCNEWGDNGMYSLCDVNIKAIARHEMIHLLIGRLHELAKDRHATLEESSEELVVKLGGLI